MVVSKASSRFLTDRMIVISKESKFCHALIIFGFDSWYVHASIFGIYHQINSFDEGLLIACATISLCVVKIITIKIVQGVQYKKKRVLDFSRALLYVNHVIFYCSMTVFY